MNFNMQKKYIKLTIFNLHVTLSIISHFWLNGFIFYVLITWYKHLKSYNFDLFDTLGSKMIKNCI